MKPNADRFGRITTPVRTGWAMYQRRNRLSNMIGPNALGTPRVAIASGFAALIAVIGCNTIVAEHQRLLTEMKNTRAEILRLREELDIWETDAEHYLESVSTRMRLIDIVRWFTR
ncbi:hypothetical protein DL98DRAFT_614975 [Cadophora sp. DSE1049]|nr:hypothetical protein DL98DRAFT_614975 [Cadophora sp. DSE1049]